jgi:hypothetical protein
MRKEIHDERRTNERGAALLTTLMVATLLLTAGGALLLTTSMTSTNAVDATAESQAYYAAEAGMQEVLNVLRGNVSTPAFVFKNAADPTSANASGDTSAYSRLSKWITYDYTPSGASLADRKTLTSGYSPLNGMAYSVAVYHPDAEALATTGNPPKNDNFCKSCLGPSATPQPTPSWHQWHCGHCSWDYSHHPYCAHKHCTNPVGTGAATTDDTRLLVQVTGYGPKGAVKKLEMIVKHTTFDYDTKATTLVVGPTNNSAAMHFNFTQNHDHAYSGNDLYSGSTAFINGFGFTSSNDKATADAFIPTIDGGKEVDTPKTVLIDSTTIPDWLATADDARAFLADLQNLAVAMNRYYTSASPPVAPNFGDDNHSYFTFVDGDFTIPDGKKGGGLLVVTGTCTLAGGAQFFGLILSMGDSPTGAASKFQVTLNKNAVLKGALVIAPFHRTDGPGSNFLAPYFDNSLGGDTIFQYDSGRVRDAIYTLAPRVVGIHEGDVKTPS